MKSAKSDGRPAAAWPKELLRWFKTNREDLPWRKEPRDPYAVWVSEVMLQQTQVGAVTPYFNRWMKAFPTLRALARAPQERVLKQWEGLGYYSRARNLHRAAQMVVEKHKGRLPETPEGLRALPGIGSYSAAAIASLAFGYPSLVYDGNVRRVAARAFAIGGQVMEDEVRIRLEPLLPKKTPGAFNEALMELGRRICKPKRPLCNECPIRESCRAFGMGEVESYPEAKKKAVVPDVRKAALVIISRGRIFLHRRPEVEMLGGLWGFPLTSLKQTAAIHGKRLAPVRHAYSHFRITATPVIFRDAAFGVPPNGRFCTFSQIEKLPLSTLDHKILEAVHASLML
jgi:A/G-specific adenine glycosylase